MKLAAGDLVMLQQLILAHIRSSKGTAAHILAWPLVAASRASDADAIRALLSLGANPVAQGCSALAFAAASGSTSCASLLMEAAGTDARCVPVGNVAKILGQESSTLVYPVQVAAAYGHAECVACLLNITESGGVETGWRLRELAAKAANCAGHYDVARWLEAYGKHSVNEEHVQMSPHMALPEVLRFKTVEVPSPAAAAVDVLCQVAVAASASEENAACMMDTTAERASLPPPNTAVLETIEAATEAMLLLQHDLSVGQRPQVLGVDVECCGDVICTVQLATWKRVIVVDALRLHGVMGSILQGLFRDPEVVKVFHASHNDLRWLRKNFGLQLSRLFDTAVAARELQKAARMQAETDTVISLPFKGGGDVTGLKTLCRDLLGLELDKTHQCSDWRLRPLPPAMLDYASTDAWVLPALHQKLCSLLTASSLFKVEERCTDKLDEAASAVVPGIQIELLETSAIVSACVCGHAQVLQACSCAYAKCTGM